MATKINRQWRLVARPVGLIDDSVFKWTEQPVPTPGDGEFLVRNLYLSLDPTNRIWAQEQETYLPPVSLGEVMRGICIGIVEQSRNAGFPEGTHVQGFLGWQDYAISNGSGLTILPPNPFLPLTSFMGFFGHVGLAAYFGLLEIGAPQPGETLVVSAAAGAVGSLAGQIGKIKGCRVIGIAGSDEKCQWITKELGFDAAINYKTESVLDGLRKYCPNGVDIYFDNVGGEILDTVLGHINFQARIVLCGLISQYNLSERVPGPYNLGNILIKRARIEGFIVLDYLSYAMDAVMELGQWLMEGKIKYRVDMVEGLENAPRALKRLFDGSNIGKLMLKVS